MRNQYCRPKYFDSSKDIVIFLKSVKLKENILYYFNFVPFFVLSLLCNTIMRDSRIAELEPHNWITFSRSSQSEIDDISIASFFYVY